MTQSQRRLEELTAIRRPLTDEEMEDLLRCDRAAKFTARYWSDEDFRRNEAERKRKYRGRVR